MIFVRYAPSAISLLALEQARLREEAAFAAVDEGIRLKKFICRARASETA